jgi:hypothetical protein
MDGVPARSGGPQGTAAVLGSTRWRGTGVVGVQGERAAVVSWAPEGHAAGLGGQIVSTRRCPRLDTEWSQEVDL